MTGIKICGLFRREDIDYVNESAPDYAGFILDFPKSRRNISIEQAVSLRNRLSRDIRAVCVFVDQPMENIIRAAGLIRPHVIQLHGNEDDRYIAEIREKTGLPVWKAFRIRNRADLADAEKSAADAVLLDNGYGTGEAFDWSAAAEFRRPFILAGGLTPENIPEAKTRLHPAILDISSGVETNGVKDREKIAAAVRAARR